MLTFNLKKEWFEKIKSGEKNHEYRIMSDYWIKRVTNLLKKATWEERKKGIPCCFCLGYPPIGDNTKRLYAKIIKINNFVDGKETDFKDDNFYYDFEFKLEDTTQAKLLQAIRMSEILNLYKNHTSQNAR